MATIKGKFKNKTGENSSNIIYPETDASVVKYSGGSSGATNVKEALDALDVIVSSAGVSGVKGDKESKYRTGNVNITAANIGAATENHTYHYWTNNAYYYDSYSGEKNWRIITENVLGDTLRWQANTIANKEYWDYDSSSWKTSSLDFSNLFDGNSGSSVSIPYAQRKFRFTMTASSGWPTTTLICLEGSWFNSGTISKITGTDYYVILTVETRANANADWVVRTTANFTQNCMNKSAFCTNVLHTGDTLYRFTIELAPWSNTTSNPNLKRLMILTNYSGNTLTPFTYGATGKVTARNILNATTLQEGGTDLASKYLGISAKAKDSDKLDGNDSAHYLDYNNLSNKPIFWATYGTTTGEEIAAAINAGKDVRVKYGTNIYGNPMLHSGEGRYYFSGLYGSYTRLVVTCSSTGKTWANGSKTFLGGFQVDGTSRVTSNNGYVNTINGDYDPDSNKLATASDIPTAVSELTNDRYVRYDTNSQGLTSAQKGNARTNIDALSTTGTANASYKIAKRFYKASESATATGYYRIATITHSNWAYCAFTMLCNNSYSGDKFNTLFDVRCSDSANSLNGFAFNIIGGTDISKKLVFLETKSGNNITKIEIFMKCSRYEHAEFFLIAFHDSSILNLNSSDWGDTPDKPDGTTMTGNATNTIVAANALTLNGHSDGYFQKAKPDDTNDLIDPSINKINEIYLADYLLGQLIYGGLVDASTGVATLSVSAKSKLGTASDTITLTSGAYATYMNMYFVVNAAGTFADIAFKVGDWLIASGSAWGKVDNTDEVTSVNGKTGAVTLAKTDLGLDNVDNTSDLDKPVSTATQTALDGKVDKVNGKGLSTEDFTTAEKTKLSGIAAGAEVNVNADWDATSGDAQILNKPTIPSKVSQLTNDSGYITGVSWSDVSGKPSFATVATSGDYSDLLNKPDKLPANGGVADVATYAHSAGEVAWSDVTDRPTNVSSFTNDSGYITSSGSCSYATSAGSAPANGGNADTVDGWHAVDLVKTIITLSNGTDLNTVVTSGFYRMSGSVVHGPSGADWSQLIVSRGSDTIAQIVISYGNEGMAYRNGNPSDVGGSGSWSAWKRVIDSNNISSNFATVATSGSYSDLSDKPSIPTNVSELTNDSGYITGVSWNDVSNKPSIPSGSNYVERLPWWNYEDSHNVDDLTSGITFAYAANHNAPVTGTIVTFSCTQGNYQLQLQGSYGGEGLYFRNMNGDRATWNAWREVIHAGNIGSQSVSYADSAGSAPASDVYSWAKAESKPSYDFSEIGQGNITVGYQYYINLRPDHDSYNGGMYYSTPGNEATVFANKNPVTSWIFATTDVTSRADWTTLTPSMQIKNGCVTINKAIADGSNASYNLDVNGSLNATTIYQNGSALAKVATSGSYNDLSNKPTTSRILYVYSFTIKCSDSGGNDNIHICAYGVSTMYYSTTTTKTTVMQAWVAMFGTSNEVAVSGQVRSKWYSSHCDIISARISNADLLSGTLYYTHIIPYGSASSTDSMTSTGNRSLSEIYYAQIRYLSYFTV